MNYYGLFQTWEIAIVTKLIADYKCKRYSLKKVDFDDLLQECLFHWYEVRKRYDPKREASIRTFMGRVIRNKLSNITKKIEVQKRKMFYESISIYQSTNDGDMCLGDQIADEQSTQKFQQVNLKTDLEKVFEKLSEDQKTLCKLILEQELNINEASKLMEKPRSSVYRDAVKICETFEKEGLRLYLR